MRKFNFSWLFFIFLLLAEGCASPPPDEPGRIAAISERTKNLNDIRRKAIQETASGIGAQLALAWQSKQIDRMLKAQTRRLDQVFDFNALVLNHNVLPPVLLEGRNTLNVDNAETLRLSDRDYQILFPARFVSAPPSWRDYLWMNYKKPDVPDASLLPKGKVEIDSWNKYLTLGWLNGLEQASNIFYANLGRLNRDFGGMLLYRKLYAQKLVSAPFVFESQFRCNWRRQ